MGAALLKPGALTMTTRDKARPLVTQSYREMRDVEVKPGQENELVAAASDRFATTLRTASVETMKTAPRESRSGRFIGGEQLLWTATFESDWHRYVRKSINPSTTH
jgi:hypothetical protein